MKYFFILLLICQFSTADEYLIQEMESLKSSLSQNDPDRTELTLRLADLYFDVSIQESDRKDINTLREKSSHYYENVLYGREGLMKPSAQSAIKIKFQLARVLNKLQNTKKATSYYLEVYNDKLSSKKFKREAALALAELYEENVNFELANKFYLSGIKLCESIETCNYAHYKRAWLLYKEVKLDEAITELKKSLWDSKNQARDKVINDLLLFVSASVTEGHKELAYFRELAQKSKQPDLIRKLVESFYGAGNRIAGSNVLVAWNEESPSHFYELRLLEEFYGFRNWEKVRDYLSRLEKREASELKLNNDENKEAKAMLKRVIVQLGSEASEDKKLNSELSRSIDLYLKFFPFDEMRVKLQQGWLSANSNKEDKIKRLKVWIAEDLKNQTNLKHIRKLRQTRLSLAQEEKKPQVVLEESLALSKLVADNEKREFLYVHAHEHYKLKNYDKAQPIFIQLASSQIGDDWSIKAQHLSLDIYNVKKDYKSLAAQASLWTNNESLLKDKKLAAEINEMKSVQVQAAFQYTTQLGETELALERFTKNCFDKIFEEKSCQNAKVLAVKLKKQETLVRLLEKAKDYKALIVEYELMGRFSDAAKLYEKLYLKRNTELPLYFKTALLYELDQDFKNRDRVLLKLIQIVKRNKKIDPQWENALYLTLYEAQLLNAKTLSLPWSLKKKLQIAQNLAGDNQIKANHKLLTSGLSYTGPHWAKNVISQTIRLHRKQSQIIFYGRNSERKFKKRVQALEKLQKFAVSYLEGADVQTRIYLLDILKNAFASFSFEILNTPLPEGLDQETITTIQTQLKEMSSPYQLAAGNYQKLQKEQLATLSSEQNTEFQNQLAQDEVDYIGFIKLDVPEKAIDLLSLDYSEFNKAKKDLFKAPSNLKTLTTMETFYKNNGLNRIASYFTGRINTLKEVQ